MSSEIVVQVKQLAHRLENASSSERLDALYELGSLAKTDPGIVGEYALKRTMDFLREQGSSEEYQEALDLIFRLIKNSRDKDACVINANIIVAEENNVLLFLDLLEHEDITVGIMASQILTEIHHISGQQLENQIQMCPDGMNKLLQRLPDSHNEEVRNQSIVLVQELTSDNEELKKTVVFNEVSALK